MDRSLKLSRPLVCLDLETTGLDSQNDRIIEISCVRLNPDGSREVRTRRLNPGIAISAEATAVHGVTNEMVAAEPSFRDVAKGILALLEGCDLSGFNIEHFDLPMLTREFERAGIRFPAEPVRVIDSWRIYQLREPRDLSAAYRYYCGKELLHAHSAEADAVAACDILQAQVQRYADLPEDVSGLHDVCHPSHPDWIDPDGRIMWKGDKAVLGFGKHKDRPLEVMAKEMPDYLRWMSQANFSVTVQNIVKAALRGEFPVREGVVVEASVEAGDPAPAATLPVATLPIAKPPIAKPEPVRETKKPVQVLLPLG